MWLALMMLLPGEVAMPTEQLREAVPGLAGITGFLLFPMLGAWVRLLLQYLERGRPGIARPRALSSLGIVRAIATTLLLFFFVLTTIRAGGELRDIHAEAAVFSPALQGLAVGIGFWAIYALGISTLRRSAQASRRTERKLGMLR
jgi:hypothetical protein